MTLELEKAGTNPDQARSAFWRMAENVKSADVVVGDVFHIKGQPEEVLWRVVKIHG